MQNAEPVQLRQVRDFGQIISTTFTFLKQNGKLFRSIGVLCLPFGIVGGFLAGGSAAEMQQFSFTPGNDPGAVFSAFRNSMLGMIPGYLLMAFGYILLVAVVHEYYRAYHLGEHTLLTSGDLFRRAMSQFGPYLGASLLCGLLAGIGFLLCIIPGVYVMGVLALVMPAIAIERAGGSGSLGRSNYLVQGDFWPTLGLVIVIGLIHYVINMVLQFPVMIVSMTVGINTGIEAASGGTPELPGWFRTFMMVATAVQWCVVMLSYPIISACMLLKYFSRVEEKEATGLQERLSGFDQAQ